MICEVCHAGQMVEYERKVGTGDNAVTIKGMRCDRCNHFQLENDDDVWGAVGL